MLDRNLWHEGRRSAWLWLTILFSALGGITIVAQAYFLSQAVSQVFLDGANRIDVTPLLVALLSVILLRAVLAGARDTAAGRASAQIKRDLRDRLFDHLVAAGPVRVAAEQTGELTAVLTEGIEALEAYFAEYLPGLFVAGIIPLTILMVVLPADPLSGLVLLLTGPLIPLFMVLIGRSAQRLTERQFNQLSRMSGHFLDVLQGLSTLKQLGQSKRQADNIARISDRFRQTTMSVLRVAFLSALALELLATLSVAVIAVSIGLRLLAGNLNFTLGFFILILAPEFYMPLRQLGQRFHAGMSGSAAAIRIFAFLDASVGAVHEPRAATRGAPPSDLQRDGQPPSAGMVTPSEAELVEGQEHVIPSAVEESLAPAIRFENISFTYPGRDRAALRNVSFTLAAGTTTALTGPSGGGKSTTAALLLRFIDPQEGHIWAGLQELEDIDPAQWRAAIAWVPQSPAIFQGSIAENIRLAQPEAAMDEVVSAARLARLHEAIIALPAGYDTPAGERGLGLSGGQAQRLALARAFLKNAPFLLLDEPAAHLDPATEVELLAATRDLLRGRTALVIAHRPQTIATADQVIRLEKGKVASNSGQLAVGSQQLTANSQQAPFASPPLISSTPSPPHPAAPPPPRPVPPPPLLRLLAFLKPYWARIALSVLLGTLTIGSGVALLATSAYLISAAALQPSIADLSVAIVGVRAFGLSRGIFRYLERLVSHDVTFRVLAEIRVWFYRALEPLAPARLQERGSGELLGYIVGDVEALQDFYVRGVYPVFVAMLAGAGVLLFFGAFAWQLAAVLACFLLFYALALPWLVHVLSKPYAETLARVREGLNMLLVEGIQGLADLLAFGRAADWQTAVHEKGGLLAGLQIRAAGIAGLRSGLGELLTYGAMWAVIWAAIPQAATGTLDPVYLAVLALASVAAFELVQPLPGAAQVWAESRAAAQHLFAVVDAEGNSVAPPAGPLRETPLSPAAVTEPPALQVRDLRFRYETEGPLVLDGLSFDLPPGGSLALLGRSGAGKSTLVNLLLRFWEYDSGEILLNDSSLRDRDPDSVRAYFGVVEQRPYLFNTSLYDNLRIARPEATREEIETAARRAQLHDFVSSLPGGYDTPAGSLGMAISGGERRRVAIARALLRAAPILLLDEPTAHLDPATAEAILDTLVAVAAEEGRSLLLITHDTAAAARMDRQLFLGEAWATSPAEDTG
ncbi:MAG: thiol reductant ABC exporter subunit CydD [Candidatus Promineifilaceae bacterium]